MARRETAVKARFRKFFEENGIHPVTDENDQLTKKVVRLISHWDLKRRSYRDLVDLVWLLWEDRLNKFRPRRQRRNQFDLVLHTMGSTRNKRIVAALSRNKRFWNRCWLKSVCSGIHYFRIPVDKTLLDESNSY